MKNLFYKVFYICFALNMLFILTMCKNNITNPNSQLGTPSFLIANDGSGDLAYGLYEYTVGGTPRFITNTVPRNYTWYSSYTHIKNGLIAYAVADFAKEQNTSGIAYMNTGDLENINYVPIPSADEGFYYRVHSATPKVLGDGRIAYYVTLESDSPYDAWGPGMLAIYNPADGNLELSGDPTQFILNQPRDVKTSSSYTSTNFVISPDDKYAYLLIWGWYSDLGYIVEDKSFVVRYTIGSPDSYEPVLENRSEPTAISGNNNYLILGNSNGTDKLDLTSGVLSHVSDYWFAPQPGQVSKNSSKMIKFWGLSNAGSAGFGEYDFSNTPFGWIHIIDSSKNGSFSGKGVQYSSDESMIYFLGRYYHSYEQGFKTNIFSTSIVELNETPNKIAEDLAGSFATGFFLLLNN